VGNPFLSQILVEATTILTTIVSLKAKDFKLIIFFSQVKGFNGVFSRHGRSDGGKLDTGVDINESPLIFTGVVFPNIFGIGLNHLTWSPRDDWFFDRGVPQQLLLGSSDQTFLFVEFVDSGGGNIKAKSAFNQQFHFLWTIVNSQFFFTNEDLNFSFDLGVWVFFFRKVSL